MTAATVTAAHAFTASPEDRRRCTCGKSRNTAAHGYDKNARSAARTGAETATAKQQAVLLKEARVADAAQAGEDAVAAVYASVIARRVAEVEAIAEAAEPTVEAPVPAPAVQIPAVQPVPETGGELRQTEHGARYLTAEELAAESSAVLTAPLAVITLDGAEETVQAAPTSAFSAWGAVTAGATRTPAVLPSQARKAEKAPAAARGRQVEPGTRALWVARELVAIILDSTDPAHAVIVRKLSAVIPNARGGRTIRLTEAEAELLSGIATEIETAVLDTSLQVDGAGRLARSCVTMRARLTALWA